MSEPQTSRKIRALDHDSYGTLTLIGFLVPLAGFILGIVYLTKSASIDRKLGEHLLVVGVLSSFLYGILWAVFTGTQL